MLPFSIPRAGPDAVYARARTVSARADAYLASPIILAISRYAFVRSAMNAGILS